MPLQRASLLPGVTFAPGGAFPAKSAIDRHTHERLPHSRLPDDGLAFYVDDARRLRVPATSIAWRIEDSEPGWEVAPPSYIWELSSVVFRSAIPIGGAHVSITSGDTQNRPVRDT